MSSVIDRLQRRTATPDERARVLQMTDADADDVLDALAPATRRATFRALFEEPGTASELADRLDTSVQNAHYHLTNLVDADLVEPIETVYSEKGNEMTVYGPASDPIVFVGDDARYAPVRQSLSGVVGGLGLLALASLLVQWSAERLLRSGVGPAGDIGPLSSAPPDPVSPGMAAWLVYEVLEPGLLFFLGSLAIAGVLAWHSSR